MSNRRDDHTPPGHVDLIEHAVIADADAPQALAAVQLEGIVRVNVLGETIDPTLDARPHLRVKRLQFPLGTAPELKRERHRLTRARANHSGNRRLTTPSPSECSIFGFLIQEVAACLRRNEELGTTPLRPKEAGVNRLKDVVG